MIKAHPYADAFPMMKAPALAELAIGIKKNGQRQPGVTVKGPDGEILLLDGRNRQAACKIAGVKFKTEEYEGDNPLEYVLDMNLRGRHLSVQERAEAAAKLATMTQGQRTDLASNEAKLSQADAAKKLNVSRSSVQRQVAKTKPKESKTPKTSWTVDELKEKANEELMDCFTAIAAVYGNDDTRAIRTGLIGLGKADVLFLAKLPRDKMLEIQDLVMANRWTPAHAVKFLSRMPDDDTTIGELKNYCLATKGKFFTGEFAGFTVTVKNNRASERTT